MKQYAKKLLRFGGRGTAATAEEDPHRRSRDSQASRYDALTAEEVLAHLRDLSPADLAMLADHERSHQNRAVVLRDIEALLDHEPWPGYDALDVPGVRSGLDGAGRERLATVLAYERAHRNRAGVVLAAQQLPADGRA